MKVDKRRKGTSELTYRIMVLAGTFGIVVLSKGGVAANSLAANPSNLVLHSFRNDANAREFDD